MNVFNTFANSISRAMGSPWAFATAAAFIAVWFASGPYFGYSENWQLIVNTGTTIFTFLAVFVLQHSQNRDGQAIQLKLDELIAATKDARNTLIDVENASDDMIDGLKREFARGNRASGERSG